MHVSRNRSKFYFKGLKDKICFAGTVAGSFVIILFPTASICRLPFVTEADASVNFKMVGENIGLQPFISAGIGAHKYRVIMAHLCPFGIVLE